MAISKELLDQLIADYKKPEDLIGENRQVEGDKQPLTMSPAN